MAVQVYNKYAEAMADFEKDMEQNKAMIADLCEKLASLPYGSEEREKANELLGKGLELKCFVELFDLSSPLIAIFRNRYGYDLTAPQGGSISNRYDCSSLEALANDAKSSIEGLFYLGASLTPLFFTVRGEKLQFSEEEIRSLRDAKEEARKEIGTLDPSLTKEEAKEKAMVIKAGVKLITLLLSGKKFPSRGLSDKEIAKFEKHFYK